MTKLDRNRGYGEIYGVLEGFERAKYEQEGRVFDFEGNEVLRDAPEAEPKAEPDQVGTQPAQPHKAPSEASGGMTMADVSPPESIDPLGDGLEEQHWREIKRKVEAINQVWPGNKTEGIALLRGIQK